MLAEFPHEHNGIFFHVVLWPIVHLGGTSEVWLRLPALLAFAGSVGLCACLGARLAGRLVGLGGAILLAVNPLAVSLAQQARMYGFALLFTVLAVWTLLRAIEQPSAGRWVAYALSVAGVGYSHDLALLTVLAHPVLTRGLVLRHHLRALAGAAVLLVPLAVLAVTDWGSNPLYWLTRPGLRSIEEAGDTVTGSRTALAVSAFLLLLGLVVTALGGSNARSRFREAGGLFLVAWLAVPFLVLVAVSQAKPLFLPRYLLPTIPAFCLLVALAVSSLRHPAGLAAVLVIVALFAVESVRSDVRLENSDWRAVAAYVDGHRLPGEREIVVEDIVRPVTSNVNPLAYYQRGLGINRSRLLWGHDLEILPFPFARVGPNDAVRGLGELASPSGAWLVVQNPGQFALGPLYEAARTCPGSEVRAFRGVDVLHLTPC